MNQKDRQNALDNLIRQMNEKLVAYYECSKNDEILEVRKKLRMQIRECQQEINKLRQDDNDGSVQEDNKSPAPKQDARRS